MAEPVPDFTPVHLITGFLGSGKTTLLSRLLADPKLGDTAVLINEFGEIGLDHHLLERIDERTILLQSGCVCCSIRGELSDAMRDLQSRRTRGTIPPFRRLAIESTGLADPFPVLTTLHGDPVLRHHFRVGHVVTTVDAVNGAAQLDRHPQSLKQVAVADRIVVTKTDLGRDPALLLRLRAINPAAPILFAAEASLDADDLLAADASAVRATRHWFADAPDPGHRDGIAALALGIDRPLDWTVFGVWLTMLLHCHGERILRVKGILALQGEAAPVAVHGVQHLVHPPVHMRAWPDDDRRSRLVFIVQGLDRAIIERSFAAFVGSASEVT